MIVDRDALRRELRQRRRAVPPAQRLQAAEAVAERLQALPFMPTQGYVAGYWAMDGELALHVWQLRLPPGLVYCLPVLHDDGRLRFAPWRAGDPLVTNRYGIPEPDLGPEACLEAGAIALAVLPLVAFDRSGQRLGMGAGWYDRTFAQRRDSAGPPWLAGVAYSFQEAERLDARSWDVPLDAVCTETETLIPVTA
ncbi:5-formyltetrahydrofolate cyclo-ligase [Luteimonas yindakuii]|uniref:5-formyltetrahydrofolate cyclo-ligase n=1 Tax=Luteimonas yindakuii TaxID=2565782 RepID=UPI0011076FC9|nr:5-formyltetrahydrofolate cyclo-ligase [Luteimonas yindakuii]QCU72420.1 5-formyltetrahydrofolate cyclo-ligase [Luteimonas yindakuii]